MLRLLQAGIRRDLERSNAGNGEGVDALLAMQLSSIDPASWTDEKTLVELLRAMYLKEILALGLTQQYADNMLNGFKPEDLVLELEGMLKR